MNCKEMRYNKEKAKRLKRRIEILENIIPTTGGETMWRLVKLKIQSKQELDEIKGGINKWKLTQ